MQGILPGSGDGMMKKASKFSSLSGPAFCCEAADRKGAS